MFSVIRRASKFFTNQVSLSLFFLLPSPARWGRKWERESLGSSLIEPLYYAALNATPWTTNRRIENLSIRTAGKKSSSNWYFNWRPKSSAFIKCFFFGGIVTSMFFIIRKWLSMVFGRVSLLRYWNLTGQTFWFIPSGTRWYMNVMRFSPSTGGRVLGDWVGCVGTGPSVDWGFDLFPWLLPTEQLDPSPLHTPHLSNFARESTAPSHPISWPQQPYK